jgi:hypothetical protein
VRQDRLPDLTAGHLRSALRVDDTRRDSRLEEAVVEPAQRFSHSPFGTGQARRREVPRAHRQHVGSHCHLEHSLELIEWGRQIQIAEAEDPRLQFPETCGDRRSFSFVPPT